MGLWSGSGSAQVSTSELRSGSFGSRGQEVGLVSGSGFAFRGVGLRRADYRRGKEREGADWTSGFCSSAFVSLVSCSSVFASEVFCSLGSFCDHGAYTHRRGSSLACGQYFCTACARALHRRNGRTVCDALCWV